MTFDLLAFAVCLLRGHLWAYSHYDYGSPFDRDYSWEGPAYICVRCGCTRLMPALGTIVVRQDDAPDPSDLLAWRLHLQEVGRG